MAKGALSKVAIVMKIARLANMVRVAKTRDRVMNFNQGHFGSVKSRVRLPPFHKLSCTYTYIRPLSLKCHLSLPPNPRPLPPRVRGWSGMTCQTMDHSASFCLSFLLLSKFSRS